MSAVTGKYVKTFAEASHALPDGMHMNADYPFMLPPISALWERTVALRDRSGNVISTPIRKSRDGKEYCEFAQSSSFETMFGRKPQKFKFWPFKDEHTPAIGATP